MNTFNIDLSNNPLKVQNVFLIYEENMMQVKKSKLKANFTYSKIQGVQFMA